MNNTYELLIGILLLYAAISIRAINNHREKLTLKKNSLKQLASLSKQTRLQSNEITTNSKRSLVKRIVTNPFSSNDQALLVGTNPLLKQSYHSAERANPAIFHRRDDFIDDDTDDDEYERNVQNNGVTRRYKDHRDDINDEDDDDEEGNDDDDDDNDEDDNLNYLLNKALGLNAITRGYYNNLAFQPRPRLQSTKNIFNDIGLESQTIQRAGEDLKNEATSNLVNTPIRRPNSALTKYAKTIATTLRYPQVYPLNYLSYRYIPYGVTHPVYRATHQIGLNSLVHSNNPLPSFYRPPAQFLGAGPKAGPFIDGSGLHLNYQFQYDKNKFPLDDMTQSANKARNIYQKIKIMDDSLVDYLNGYETPSPLHNDGYKNPLPQRNDGYKDSDHYKSPLPLRSDQYKSTLPFHSDESPSLNTAYKSPLVIHNAGYSNPVLIKSSRYSNPSVFYSDGFTRTIQKKTAIDETQLKSKRRSRKKLFRYLLKKVKSMKDSDKQKIFKSLTSIWNNRRIVQQQHKNTNEPNKSQENKLFGTNGVEDRDFDKSAVTINTGPVGKITLQRSMGNKMDAIMGFLLETTKNINQQLADSRNKSVANKQTFTKDLTGDPFTSSNVISNLASPRNAFGNYSSLGNPTSIRNPNDIADSSSNFISNSALPNNFFNNYKPVGVPIFPSNSVPSSNLTDASISPSNSISQSVYPSNIVSNSTNRNNSINNPAFPNKPIGGPIFSSNWVSPNNLVNAPIAPSAPVSKTVSSNEPINVPLSYRNTNNNTASNAIGVSVYPSNSLFSNKNPNSVSNQSAVKKELTFNVQQPLSYTNTPTSYTQFLDRTDLLPIAVNNKTVISKQNDNSSNTIIKNVHKDLSLLRTPLLSNIATKKFKESVPRYQRLLNNIIERASGLKNINNMFPAQRIIIESEYPVNLKLINKKHLSKAKRKDSAITHANESLNDKITIINEEDLTSALPSSVKLYKMPQNSKIPKRMSTKMLNVKQSRYKKEKPMNISYEKKKNNKKNQKDNFHQSKHFLKTIKLRQTMMNSNNKTRVVKVFVINPLDIDRFLAKNKSVNVGNISKNKFIGSSSKNNNDISVNRSENNLDSVGSNRSKNTQNNKMSNQTSKQNKSENLFYIKLKKLLSKHQNMVYNKTSNKSLIVESISNNSVLEKPFTHDVKESISNKTFLKIKTQNFTANNWRDEISFQLKQFFAKTSVDAEKKVLIPKVPQRIVTKHKIKNAHLFKKRVKKRMLKSKSQQRKENTSKWVLNII